MTDVFGPGFESLQLHFKAFQFFETLFLLHHIANGIPKISIDQWAATGLYLACSFCQLSRYYTDE